MRAAGAPDDCRCRCLVFGSELTAQLRALADAAAKQIGFDRALVWFVLLDLSDHVMPELGQGKIAPPTAQHAVRQVKTLTYNVAASLGYRKRKDYRHSDKGMVVDLGPRYAVANPLGVHLSGYPAKFVTRAYHLYALPRLVNRWAVAIAYLTAVFFARTVLSVGFAEVDLTAGEVIRLSKAACAE